MSIMEQTLRQTITDYELRIPMSYEDFVDEFHDVHAEWVNGEVIIFMPAATQHQRIVTYLMKLLGIYIEFFQLGELFTAPFQMKAPASTSAREPDILFIKSENLDKLEEQRLAGAADLVIEVVSPESVKRDNEEKFAEYEANGVQEYWIIDSREDHQQVEFWVLDENGRYQSMPIVDKVYHSTALSDFWLNTDWLWDIEKYSALAAFAQIAELPAEMAEILRGKAK